MNLFPGLFHQLMVGQSAPLVQLFRQMAQAAKSDITVCLQGPSGVGKELVARAIHGVSARRLKPLVTVNCGAIPENLVESILFGHVKGAFTGATEDRMGKFHEANGGTLFLDEIGELTPAAQVRLLRVLQERVVERVGSTTSEKIDLRLICATHRDLQQMVKDHKFREDLFYRIHVLPLHLPTLQERRDDIPLLVNHFLEKFCALEKLPAKTLTPAALAALQNFSWPGNIRQLENAIHRAVVAVPQSVIDVGDIPLHKPLVNAPVVADWRLSSVEAAHLQRALQHTRQNISQAAKLLGISRATLYRKCKTYNLLETTP